MKSVRWERKAEATPCRHRLVLDLVCHYRRTIGNRRRVDRDGHLSFGTVLRTVIHLEIESYGPGSARGGRVRQFIGIDVRFADGSWQQTGGYRRAVMVERAGCRDGGDLDALQFRSGVGVGKREIAGDECVSRILLRGDGSISGRGGGIGAEDLGKSVESPVISSIGAGTAQGTVT